jgi:hypothetical protein
VRQPTQHITEARAPGTRRQGTSHAITRCL